MIVDGPSSVDKRQCIQRATKEGPPSCEEYTRGIRSSWCARDRLLGERHL